jgi:hypothetical protein
MIMPDSNMSPTLYLAILSMDFYNRGHNVGKWPIGGVP